jgi:hypothetical protein
MHSMTEGISLILGRSHAFGKSVQVYALHIYRGCSACPTWYGDCYAPRLGTGILHPRVQAKIRMCFCRFYVAVRRILTLQSSSVDEADRQMVVLCAEFIS